MNTHIYGLVSWLLVGWLVGWLTQRYIMERAHARVIKIFEKNKFLLKNFLTDENR